MRTNSCLLMGLVFLVFATPAKAERKNPDLPYGGFAIDLNFNKSLIKDPYLSEIAWSTRYDNFSDDARQTEAWYPISESTSVLKAKFLFGLGPRVTLNVGVNSHWTSLETGWWWEDSASGDSSNSVQTSLLKTFSGEVGLRIYLGGSED